MRGGILLACFYLGIAGGSRADTPAQVEVSKAIHAGFDAMNGGDANGLAAFYDPTAIIVDDSEPYVWTAPRALEAWQVSEDAWARTNGVSSVTCALKKTVRNEVSGDHAYFVGNGSCTAMKSGARSVQDGVWTFVMVRRPDRWRIVLMSFAGEALTPR